MQHPLIEFNPFEYTINIRSLNKRIDVNSDKFHALQVVMSEILQCSISINRNKIVSLDNLPVDDNTPVALFNDTFTVDWLINAEQWKPTGMKDFADGVRLGMFDPSRYAFAPTINEGIKESRLEMLKDIEGKNPVIAIPVEALLREKYDFPTNYVQLIQITFVTEPNDVGLVGLILKILRLML